MKMILFDFRFVCVRLFMEFDFFYVKVIFYKKKKRKIVGG